jgi:hypothetical protein
VGREHDAVKEGEWANSDEYSAEKIAQNVASRCALDLRGKEMSKVLGKGAISPRTRTRRPGLCAQLAWGLYNMESVLMAYIISTRHAIRRVLAAIEVDSVLLSIYIYSLTAPRTRAAFVLKPAAKRACCRSSGPSATRTCLVTTRLAKDFFLLVTGFEAVGIFAPTLGGVPDGPSPSRQSPLLPA